MFLLALVAVGAPVWANAYVCPMKQAAIAEREAIADKAGCCTKTHASRHSAPDASRIEPPCDCAQLQWDVSDINGPRSETFTSVSPLWAPTVDRLLAGLLNPVSRLRVVARPAVAISSPPLWVRNQSIRC
jgi:hypothetical protein